MCWDVSSASSGWGVNDAHTGHITALAWQQQGADNSPSLALSGGQDGCLKVWDGRSGSCVATQSLHADARGKGAIGGIVSGRWVEAVCRCCCAPYAMCPCPWQLAIIIEQLSRLCKTVCDAVHIPSGAVHAADRHSCLQTFFHMQCQSPCIKCVQSTLGRDLTVSLLYAVCACCLCPAVECGSRCMVVTAGADQTLRVVDPAASYRPLQTIPLTDFPYSLVAVGDGLVACGCGDGSVHVVDVVQGRPLYALGAGRAAVRAMEVGPGRLVCSGDDGCVVSYQFV
jgi:WD40 repeat protein